jgi:hypothetical protein
MAVNLNRKKGKVSEIKKGRWKEKKKDRRLKLFAPQGAGLENDLGSIVGVGQLERSVVKGDSSTSVERGFVLSLSWYLICHRNLQSTIERGKKRTLRLTTLN